MIVNHVVIDRGSVTVRWAVAEKICGYRARKFSGKMVMNISIRMASVPFSFFPKVYETSFLNVTMIFLFTSSKVLTFFHILIENGKIAINTATHAMEKMEVEGSKVENRFVIIFTFLFC